MASRTGRLRQRLTIETRDDTESGDASMSVTYTPVDTISCKAHNVSGKRIVNNRGAQVNITHEFEIRYYPSITVLNSVLYKGFRYQIEAVRDDDEKKPRRIFLQCRPIALDGTLQDPSPQTFPEMPV